MVSSPITKTWRLGVVGMSPGNGHPYSWSAICNGYDPQYLRKTEYPQIADYLAQQHWPAARLLNARVEYVWCDQKSQAQSVATASCIAHVCDTYEELLKLCDAVLLARDDVVERRPLVQAALASGKPVFIDKPFGLSRAEAEGWLQQQDYPWQIFTASALRYAPEILLTPADRESIGPLRSIVASTPKYWSTYAVHLLEPLVAQWGAYVPYRFVHTSTSGEQRSVSLAIKDIPVQVQCLGDCKAPIKIEYWGERDRVTKTFSDAFRCFKTSLSEALLQWENQHVRIDPNETLKIAEMISWGMP
jgi:hypothetical protein